MGTESQELSKEKLKSCELCQSKEAIVFCRAGFAFLCAICFAELRNARDSVSLKCRQLQRGWTCVDCEQDHTAAVLFDENGNGVDDAVTTLCIASHCDGNVHPHSRHKRIIVNFTNLHH